MSTLFTPAAQKVFGKVQALVGKGRGGFLPHTASRLVLTEPACDREATPGTSGDREEGPAADSDRFEPVLRIVRRALVKDAATSAMTRRIHALAEQMGSAGDRETLIRRVARVICHSTQT